ncbi:MAG: hypothetical protein ACI86M_003764, partial [Saprospiraceae bacterium]
SGVGRLGLLLSVDIQKDPDPWLISNRRAGEKQVVVPKS